MNLGLKDRVALVAASSQGIGRATAEAFAAEGCRVAMCARNTQALNVAADAIRKKHGAQIFAEALDVTDAAAVARFVADVAGKFGRVDICVTNAGGPPAKGFLAASLDEWQRALAANFLSTVYFAREVIPHMQRQRWGRIITLTSITTKQPVADLVLSNAVRAAVVGLVKSLANEFGKDGILVNNIGPGFTATDRLRELAKTRAAAQGKSEQELFDGWAADAPVKRLGEPREVAETIVWLASERASYVTGQTISADGGHWMLGCAFVSRQLWGYVADRIGGLQTILAGSACQITAMIGFLLTQNEAGLFAVSAWFGLGFSGLIPAYVLAMRELFPASEASWRIPIFFLCGGSGMAAGGWLAGEIYDRAGLYAPAFAAGIAFNLANLVIVGLLVLRDRGPRRRPAFA
jgi:3-oxoacyl-[acyl-carrier protein] reductase